ncbi:hypothetical protein [Streptomyces sp. NPDC058441]|uniref:hypothetical protein n=1 Tax=Streptomyces sp. NPDC058441 TaxID=3346502 RepID=UPI0036636363
MTASADLRALVRERHHHDLCRAALAAMIEGADEQVVIGENASGADAEVLGYQLRSKAKELHELPEVPLFFGRLDFADGIGVRLLRTALTDSGIEVGGADDPRARVTVLGASVAKRLEYDHVVAVEPAAVAEAERRGLHRLYVVLTRAVSRLDVVHSRPLPFAAAS